MVIFEGRCIWNSKQVLCGIKLDMQDITQDINVQFARRLHLTSLLLLNVIAPLHFINSEYTACLSKKLIKYLWKYNNHKVTLFLFERLVLVTSAQILG